MKILRQWILEVLSVLLLMKLILFSFWLKHGLKSKVFSRFPSIKEDLSCFKHARIVWNSSINFFILQQKANQHEKRWANCVHFPENLYIIDYPRKVCRKCQTQTSSKIFNKILQHKAFYFSSREDFSDFPMGMVRVMFTKGRRVWVEDAWMNGLWECTHV